MTLIYFEIKPSKEYSEGNPFTATGTTPDNYNCGHLRIQPPFTITEDFANLLSGDVDVVLKPRVTTEFSTTLDFYIEDEEKPFGERPVEELVRHTVQKLLAELGRSASENLFLLGEQGKESDDE